MNDSLPTELQIFLGKHVSSIWVLELLLFMRENSEREWDTVHLNRQLRGTFASTQACLDEFVAKNIFTIKKSDPPLYRFNMADTKLKDIVDRLAQFYISSRNKVIDWIYSAIWTKNRSERT